MQVLREKLKLPEIYAYMSLFENLSQAPPYQKSWRLRTLRRSKMSVIERFYYILLNGFVLLIPLLMEPIIAAQTTFVRLKLSRGLLHMIFKH